MTPAFTTACRDLPVWEMLKGWRGFGPLSLAIIIGEAGDLGIYSTRSKLYKRFGLAVFDGVAQGTLPAGLPRERRADAWKARGYNPSRRSRMWTIASSMLMAGNERCRAFYLDRKAYERARAEAEGLTVAPAAKVPKRRAAEYRTLGHIDLRARRYMEKHVLCDVWRAWRRAHRDAAR